MCDRERCKQQVEVFANVLADVLVNLSAAVNARLSVTVQNTFTVILREILRIEPHVTVGPLVFDGLVVMILAIFALLMQTFTFVLLFPSSPDHRYATMELVLQFGGIVLGLLVLYSIGSNINSAFGSKAPPRGSVLPFLGHTAPRGYILADGSPWDEATHAERRPLRALLNTPTIPDLRGRFLCGVDNRAGTRELQAGGENRVLLRPEQIPQITGRLPVIGMTADGPNGTLVGGNVFVETPPATNRTFRLQYAPGTTHATVNQPPANIQIGTVPAQLVPVSIQPSCIYVNYIIKL